MMYLIRFFWKFATKHTQSHTQKYHLVSENSLEVIQGITSCNFSCVRKQDRFGTLKLRGKVDTLGSRAEKLKLRL